MSLRGLVPRGLASLVVLLAAGLGACGPRQGSAERGGAGAGPRRAIVAPVTLERACVTSGPERCFDASDDNCNGVVDEGCGIETGFVQFAVAWQPAQADVDLLVSEPSGEVAEVGKTSTGGLVKQQDCPGRDDECRGQSLENVYLERDEPRPGPYRVRIVLQDLNGTSPPVNVRFGARVGYRSYSEDVRLERRGATYDASFTL